jgi:hypothetical protein
VARFRRTAHFTIRKATHMEQPGLDQRHRDKNGEISKKHGNTLVRTLRKIYGKAFAAGQPDTTKLSDVLLSLTTRRSGSLSTITKTDTWKRRSNRRRSEEPSDIVR